MKLRQLSIFSIFRTTAEVRYAQKGIFWGQLMSFGNDHIRRLVEEQDRVQRLIDQALGGPTMRAIAEASDPLRQLRNQIPSVLGIAAGLSSSIQASLDANLLAVAATNRLAPQLFKDQHDLVEQARKALASQLHQYQLADRAIKPFLDFERLTGQLHLGSSAVDSMSSMQASIDGALNLARGIDAKTLLAMSPDMLMDKIAPLRSRLLELEQNLGQLAHHDEPEDQKAKLTRANLLAGLDMLRVVLFEYVYKIVMIWLALSSSGNFDQQQLDRIERSVLQLVEHHHTVSALHDDIAEGHQLLVSVTTTEVFLRTGPSQLNESIVLLQPSARFLITRQQGEWSAGLATMADGKQFPGWIHTDYLVHISPEVE